MAIINNPFDIVEEAFKNLHPDKSYKAYIDTDVRDDKGETAFGVTLFQEDGSEPTVFISADLKLSDSVEIFAHELAHVAAGVDEGHGEMWEHEFEKIFKEYNRIGIERFGEPQEE